MNELTMLELVLAVWLTEPVIRSVCKGATYASLMFARGEYAQGFAILTRIPSAILLLATWPYTSTVGAITSAIATDELLQRVHKGSKNAEG